MTLQSVPSSLKKYEEDFCSSEKCIRLSTFS